MIKSDQYSKTLYRCLCVCAEENFSVIYIELECKTDTLQVHLLLSVLLKGFDGIRVCSWTPER